MTVSLSGRARSFGGGDGATHPHPAPHHAGCRRCGDPHRLPGPGAVPSGGDQRAGQGPPPALYYLALGDSLARGVQPDAAGVSVQTPDGYPDQVYAALRPSRPGLRLVKLGTRVPRNVAWLCQWTWQCAAPPRGPNQHANRAGYQVIAREFLQAAGLG